MKGEVWAQKYKMPSLVHLSLVPNPCMPPGEKQSGERNQISLASTLLQQQNCKPTLIFEWR